MPASARLNSADFAAGVAAALAKPGLREAVEKATLGRWERRQRILQELGDVRAAFALAGRIRSEALASLDEHLSVFADNVRQAGGHVHFTATAVQACDVVREIARGRGVRRVVKAKSMITEEIGLAAALEGDGLEVVETDLGEFVVQIDHDRPSHIVAPIIHKTAKDVARLFTRVLGIDYTEDPEALTAAARRHLREKFRTADMGICGCNFAVAETGTVCIVTNEGNGAIGTSRPKVVVAVMGMERIVPTTADLAVMLKLLPKSGTGLRSTVYVSLLTGPRRTGELDGPEEFHVVVVDGGRSAILASEYRDVLRCIRCGACLNVCPVYRTIGGHAYNSVYPGPIGAVLSPLLFGFDAHKDLPQASSLCGACFDACPVQIDLPRLLVRLRDDLRRRGGMPWGQRLAFRLWRLAMSSNLFYRVGGRFLRWMMKDSSSSGWCSRLPGPLAAWTDQRDFPTPAPRPFHKQAASLRNSAPR